MNTPSLLKLATLGTDPRTRGFGDPVAEGDYHIVGTSVILRKGPAASAESIGTLQNGENVYAFGETEIDETHMIDRTTHEATINDGSSPGIEYVRVGTQTHGPGWVAINFLTPGRGAAVETPKPAPEPMSIKPTMTTKDKITTFLVGGLIGVTVLGGIVLLVRNAKSPRRLAHA